MCHWRLARQWFAVGRILLSTTLRRRLLRRFNSIVPFPLLLLSHLRFSPRTEDPFLPVTPNMKIRFPPCFFKFFTPSPTTTCVCPPPEDAPEKCDRLVILPISPATYREAIFDTLWEENPMISLFLKIALPLALRAVASRRSRCLAAAGANSAPSFRYPPQSIESHVRLAQFTAVHRSVAAEQAGTLDSSCCTVCLQSSAFSLQPRSLQTLDVFA